MTSTPLPAPVRSARNVLWAMALLTVLCGGAMTVGVGVMVGSDVTLGGDAWLTGVVFAVPVALVWLVSAAVHVAAGAMLQQASPMGRWLTAFLGVLWLASPLFLLGGLLLWWMLGDELSRLWWAEVHDGRVGGSVA